jgi:glutathione synthase/RimK-type ligase-like ATP-grasp enzyme
MAIVGFATSERHAELVADDRLAAARLRALGLEVRPVVWTRETARVDGCAAVVVRSCWDYHLMPAQFHAWIRAVEARGASVWNPPAMIAWNTDKEYLRALEVAGVPVPDTIWVARGEQRNLTALLRERGWARAVVKPAISATAWRTFVTRPATARSDQERLDEILTGSGALVQEFVDAIETEGEWSLVFFDGAFSHAVVKRPTSGDFRVQEDFGGSSTPEVPSAGLVEAASHALRQVPGSPLYARVDGVVVDDAFVLMEMELIEPSLFLASDAGAADRFAQAIVRRL